MKIKYGMWLVAVLGSILLGSAGAWAQTQPTSLAISPLNPTLNLRGQQQFKAQSGNALNLSESIEIASGGHHTCAVMADGTAKCWGWNTYGQLGDGTTTTRSTPVAVKNLSGAVAIAAGQHYTCALLSDGTVKCWGDNEYGQLGNGTETGSPTPVAVFDLIERKDLSGVVAIAAGLKHTCALLSDGTVKCWGDNRWGQLGNGKYGEHVDSNTPVNVKGLTNAVAIAAGWYNTCAVLADGTAKCWGHNGFGQLGDGTRTNHPTPVTVSGLSDAVAIAAGSSHICAVLSDGTAKCWGYDRYGQLGDGNSGQTLVSTTPVAVRNLSGAVAISGGTYHTCALLSNGMARCWGYNSYGQLGDGTTTTRLTPVAVGNLSGAVAIAAGEFNTCALVSDGTARCWGANDSGQLGDGTRTTRPTPVAVIGKNELPRSGALDLATGYVDTCAVLADGTAKCWGYNRFGQLGDGTTIDHSSPAPVIAAPGSDAVLSGVMAISTGGYHTCALLADGTVKCWGYNGSGQLGDGNSGLSLFSATPVPVNNLSGAVAIATGEFHSCTLLAGGTVKCWGDNSYGQLGDRTETSSALPATVVADSSGTPLKSVVEISAGSRHTCALLANGTVKCWGRNNFGQLGDGDTRNRTTPVNVRGLTNVVAIAAGYNHTCALLTDGTAKCWGSNGSGQLGDETSFARRLTPATVKNLSGAVAIAAGMNHSCALLADGTAKCWGSNGSGQLGNGRAGGEQRSPVPVRDLSGAISIASGALANHTCALLADGTAECWGRNDYGQLGDGTTTDAYTPVSTEALVLSLKWSSDDTDVATIGATSGLAKAVAPGSALITATYGALSANTTLTVAQPSARRRHP